MKPLLGAIAGLLLLLTVTSPAFAQSTLPAETILANDADRFTSNTDPAMHNLFETDIGQHLDRLAARCAESRQLLGALALLGQQNLEANGLATDPVVYLVMSWDGMVPSAGTGQDCGHVLAQMLVDDGLTSVP